MTHVATPGGGPSAPHCEHHRRDPGSSHLKLDHGRLREAIAVRRQRLAEREADLVAAACEKAVAHGAGGGTSALTTAATWDRAAWNRYVEDCDGPRTPSSMPEMLRLIRDIPERLERPRCTPPRHRRRRPRHERRTAE